MTKLALGINLDDEAQSVLMNVFRGDAERLLTPADTLIGLVPIIRPFLYIPAREVALYAYLHAEGFEIRRCPYSHNVLSTDVHALLNDYTWRHPSTKYALANLGGQLVSYGLMSVTHADICPVFGEPDLSESRLCRMP
jgi:tRNA(Ile)-lysidine synthase TilS/MesJ